ncbi:Crp/Fnr family transcriptional regulator [Actibacterium lipolyticum]|uniref:Crp/Fnr family transcriptional regulator n=1 Tax=Actibacterium lipolyticum TaxID=1524263 RepID=UPI0015955C06|nr:Crp/Fnr family transcriptional regulator [Actibacterium lipolyticum]
MNACKLRVFERRTEVFTQGEPAEFLMLIAHGLVEVSYVSQDGHKVIVYHAGPGETLGEIELIAEKPCAASCYAFENTTVLLLPPGYLSELMTAPGFIKGIARSLHEVMVRDNNSKAVDQFYSVEQSLCSYLLSMSGRATKITISQSYLANVVGCSRQTVNRELGVLRDANLIALQKGVIEVLDRDALQTWLANLEDKNGDSATAEII